MSKEATRIYSTCRSGESVGYCGLSFRDRWTGWFKLFGLTPEAGLEGVGMLLADVPRRALLFGGIRGAPFPKEVFDGVREGKDEREPCLPPPPPPLLELPLVVGRWEKTVAISR